MAGGGSIVGQLGPLPIYAFGLTAALGFLAGTVAALAQAPRYGIPRASLFQAAPLVMAAGVVGGRVLYVLGHLADYRLEPAAVFRLPEGGFAFYGALAAGAAALAWAARREGFDAWRALDVVAPGLALGQAIGFLGVQALGTPAGVPWGVWQGDAFVHPVPAYAIIFSYWLFFALLRLDKLGPAPGRLFLVYLFLHGLGWTVLDVWAAAPRLFGLTAMQWAGLGAAALAAGGLLWLRRRVKRPAPKETGAPATTPLAAPGPDKAARLWRAGVWLGGLAALLLLYWIRWA